MSETNTSPEAPAGGSDNYEPGSEDAFAAAFAANEETSQPSPNSGSPEPGTATESTQTDPKEGVTATEAGEEKAADKPGEKPQGQEGTATEDKTSSTATHEPVVIPETGMVKIGDADVPVEMIREALGRGEAVTQAEQRLINESRQYADGLQFVQQQHEAVVKAAEARFALVSSIDPREAAKWDDATYREYQQELAGATKELENVKQSQQDIQGRLNSVNEETFKREATACVKALMDPIQGIPGCDTTDKLSARYGKLADYATKSFGIKPEEFGRITDPVSLRVLDKAMRYDEAFANIGKAVSVKKVTATTTPANKTGTGEPAPARKSAAMDQFRKDGSVDSMAAALVASGIVG